VNDLVFKTMNAVHHGLLKVSGGRIGWKASKMPVIALTTTGRKSGQRRTVMLTSPLQDGPSMVVVASRGGDDRHPAWFLNLRDNPDVEVSVQGRPEEHMRARVASPEERARLWPLVTKDFRNYANYQTKTEREIPLVLLDPAS
jgi:deazaflavin-dependent oxidoreductase (nitroreductase family)